jgi:outer membrane murein-binding lipoprotein Lpp
VVDDMAKDADKIDELASNIDDLKTVVDELEDDPTVNQGPVKTLKKAVRKADGATAKLEDDLDGGH